MRHLRLELAEAHYRCLRQAMLARRAVLLLDGLDDGLDDGRDDGGDAAAASEPEGTQSRKSARSFQCVKMPDDATTAKRNELASTA